MAKIVSDCNKCRVKIEHVWQCWEIYDGNSCPSFEDVKVKAQRDEALTIVDAMD